MVERARQIFHAGNGEVLFARCVVLVEGESELGALTVLADRYWRNGGAAGMGVSFISIDGAQNLKGPIVALERLGVRWVALVDGDAEGESGLKNAGEAIELDLSSSPNIVIPSKDGINYTFDAYLVQEGFRMQLEEGISALSGPDALEEYRNNNHDQPYPKNRGGKRNYKSEGWEERLVLDWIERHKSSYGAPFARACVNEETGEATIPPKILEVFERADSLLESS